MELEDIPTYEITMGSMKRISRIEDLLASAKALGNRNVTRRLRKESLIRSINSSLAIEGNRLEFPQVRDMINGKHVEGPFDEIVEAKNAIKAYDMMRDADPWSEECMLDVYDTLMFGLVQCEGFRTFGVGVFEGDNMVYKAPEHEMVRPMIERLLSWGRTSETHPLIKSAVVHYYIEAIHPFEDGNGRMGRLWQTMILTQYDRTFSMIPVESGIRKRQAEYYDALERCHNSGSNGCTGFVDFMLDVFEQSLEGLLHLLDERMRRLLDAMGDGAKSAREIMGAMGLKDRNNLYSNYLRPAMEYGLIEMTEAPNSPRQRYRRLLR